MTMTADLLEPEVQEDADASLNKQIEKLYQVVEHLEDLIVATGKREQQWQKEKKQLLENQSKVEKKVANADDDVKFIKEKLDATKKELEIARKEKDEALANLKKEREQMAGNASKERERLMAAAKQQVGTLQHELKQLKHQNGQLKENNSQLKEQNGMLKQHLGKVTTKLDAAIEKISELVDA